MHHLDAMLTSPCCQSVASLRQLQGGTKPERRLSGTSGFAYSLSLNCQRITSRRPWGKSNNRCQAQNSSDTSSEFEDSEAKTLPPPPKRNKGFGSPTPKLKSPKTIPSESNAEGVGSERRAREPRAPGVRRRAAPEKPLVLAAISETDKRIETAALGLLGVLFVLIFAEGIFLGISGKQSQLNRLWLCII